MTVYEGVVLHADEMQGQQTGSLWVTNVKYRKSVISVEVPPKGGRTDVVQCAICGEALHVQIASGRRNTLVSFFRTAVVLVIVVGLGWGLFLSIASGGLTNSICWKKHHFKIAWNESGKIDLIQFGETLNSAINYGGPFPFGLRQFDKQPEFATKLGPPTTSNDFHWLGSSKTGHSVEIHIAKSSYSDSTMITDVTVREKGRRSPAEQTHLEQDAQKTKNE